MMIQKIRGTRDILEMKIINKIINATKKVLHSHCFNEITLPILESADLFKKTLGETTDVISKELFLVKNTHEENDQICLRPEATASTFRSYILNKPIQNPWKVFTYGPMFRYERPQKGRYREFYQLNIELINAKSCLYDIELISVLNKIFKNELKINDFQLEINYLGESHDRKAYKEILKEFIFSSANVPEKIVDLASKNILRIFDLKEEECKKFLSCAPLLTDYLSTESLENWNTIKNMLDILNISYTSNPKLVRGLDYYNNTIFEFTSSHLGSQNAFCGGGRYDDIGYNMGINEKIHSLGAAIGIDRIALILEQINPAELITNKKYGFLVLNEEYNIEALNLISELRNYLPIELYADKNSLKNGLKKADSEKTAGVFILGDNEYKENKLMYKNMNSGEQNLISFSEINAFAKSLL